MEDDLRAALRAAGDEFKTTRAAHDHATEKLKPLLVEALRDPKVEQRELVDLSGYTRENLRRLARNNGIVSRRPKRADTE